MKKVKIGHKGCGRSHIDLPPNAVREYIVEMLAELCDVAKKGKHEDLHVLLKLTYQAARKA